MRKVELFVVVIILLVISLFLLLHFNTEKSPTPLAKITPSAKIKNMKILSSAFENNQTIPSVYTCQGENRIPPLTFTDIPKNTKSLAIIVDDPDAPMGTFVHWVVYNILPTTSEVKEGEEIPGSTYGKNGAGQMSFIGPCPPTGTHRYFFKLYALDTTLSIEKGADKSAVEKAMEGYILDHPELIGLYQKK